MARCIKCGFSLVLLSNRRKYKCAKCSRLFNQKEIDNKEFQNWNKNQRELDNHNLNLKITQKRQELSPDERKLRARESAKKWRLKNKDKIQEYKQNYRKRNKEKYNLEMQKYRNKHKEQTKFDNSLANLRRKQKMITLQFFENSKYNSLTTKSQKVLPTFLHSELLKKPKSL